MTIKTPSDAVLLKPETLATHDRGGGARTTPLVTPSVGTTSFITGYTSFDGGVEIPFHSHNCEESVMVLEGRALVEIDGTEYEVGTHDVTFLPANVPHRFRNASTTERMRILWTYASIDATRTIVATGDTRTIDAEHHAKIV